jgi:hypothetical protein
MPLTEIAVDDGPHTMDGLVLHAWDGSEKVEAFISRRVMDSWVDPIEPYEVGELSSVPNTTRSASITLRRLSESSRRNIGVVGRSTASIPSSMFCSQTSQKAERCST